MESQNSLKASAEKNSLASVEDVRKVIIIGGGIGGLTTAVALQQRGIEAHVYEAAPAIEPLGAGILIAPNALSVFERLGFADDIKHIGFPLYNGVVTDMKGRTLQQFDVREFTQEALPIVPIHRAKLQDCLIRQMKPETLHLGKRTVSLSQSESGVTASFEDGSEATGDVLIGADGIRSRVRTSLFGEVQYRYSGQTCWRGVVNVSLPENRVTAEMWGIERGVRFGYTQIDAESVYFFATACAEAGGQDTPGMVKSHLLELYREFPPVVRQCIQALNDDAEHPLIRSDIWDFAPIPTWHKGRVVLLGDAAHATTPNLGQGGCQAIEDAFVIADALAEQSSIEVAFEEYERIRMPKARFVVQTSYRIAQLVNLGGIPARMRNFLARYAPKAASQRQFRYLYSNNF